MLETFWNIVGDLFSYREFLAVFHLFQSVLWVLILVVIVMVVMHVLYMLGYQTPLYKRRSPRAHWSKRFFRGAVVIVLLILSVLAGAEWLEKNAPRADSPRTVFQQLLPALKRL